MPDLEERKEKKALKKKEEADKELKGCILTFWFFIAILIGMIFVLFIKINYFSNITNKW